MENENNGFIDRLIDEKKQLDLKLSGLGNFINSKSFENLSNAHRNLLRMQLKAMCEYSDILAIRLELLGVK
jgi:hypothetical protein